MESNMNRKSIIATIIACIMILLLIIPAGTAFAADLSDTLDFITGVSLTDTAGNPFGANIAKDSALKLEYTYTIPNDADVHEGDTFTLHIPTEIAISAPGEFTLTDDGSGQVIGTGTLAVDGTLVVTFTQFVETYSNIHGNFWFDLAFDEDDIGDDDPARITFNVGASTDPYIIEIDFDQPAPVQPTITKSGSYNAALNEITWTITANPEAVEVSNAIITDTIPAGQSFIAGSVTVNGAAAVPANYTYDAGTKVFTYTFPAAINSQQVLTLRTSIDDSEFTSRAEGASFTEGNTASLTHDGGGATSNEATITANVNFIQKTGTYDSAAKRINWTILINYNRVTIPDAVITDTLPAGLSLTAGTVNISPAAPAGSGYTYDAGTRTLVYTFGGPISAPYTLTFSTDVDPAVYDRNQTVNYSNTAVVTGSNVPGGATDMRGVGVNSTIIDKQGQAYNRATGEITWLIIVDVNEVPIQNCVVRDTINAGQEFIPSSVLVDGAADPLNFTYDAGTRLFTYTFPADINELHRIEFRTRVTDPAVYMSNANRNYSNTATISGSNIPNSSDTATRNVVSQVIAKTSTNYNYETREIDWRIVVNANQMPLSNVVVTDDIRPGQEYVAGSAVITGAGADQSGFAYTAAAPGDVTKTGTLTYTFPGNITAQYIITFKTRITDLSIFGTNGDQTLQNSASLTHNFLPGGVTGSGTCTVHNVVIGKTGSYTSGNKYIDWTIVLNTNTINLLEDAEIVDVLQEGLALDTNTVRLYHMTVNPDGTLVDGAEIDLSADNVDYDIATRTLAFHIPAPISGAYKLTMRTNVTDKTRSPFTNSASFSGTGTNQTGTSNQIAVAWAGSGSTGTGETGSIRVYKVDSLNNTERLVGCEFELLDRYGNVVGRMTTGADGYVLFDMLRFDINYTVREVTPPEGYLISDEEYTFQLHSGADTENIVYDYADEEIMGQITLTKYNFDMEPVPGTGFTLYDEGGNAVMTALSGDDGVVVFTNVPYGDYTVRETAPAPGYFGSSDELTASITVDGSTVTTTPAFIQDEEYLSSVRILKFAEDSVTPVSGARFGLYRTTDTAFRHPVAQAVSAAPDGEVVFENIGYGDYVIREISAPAGFAVSRITVPVQVREDGEVIEAGTFTDRRRPPEDSPETGDSILLYGGIFLACAAGLAALVLIRGPKKAVKAFGVIIDRRKAKQ